jgi:hypothetical protein
MSETLVIPPVEDIFPSADGSAVARKFLATLKLLTTVGASLVKFREDNLNSSSNLCEVDCSEFPQESIDTVAYQLKATGYHVRLKRWYGERDIGAPYEFNSWNGSLQISSQSFPKARPLWWWQRMLYSVIHPITYIVY